jgi:hypothetical protein
MESLDRINLLAQTKTWLRNPFRLIVTSPVINDYSVTVATSDGEVAALQ